MESRRPTKRHRTLAEYEMQNQEGYFHLSKLKLQHRSNLLCMVKEYLLEHDWSRLASVLAVGLSVEPAENLNPSWQWRQRAANARAAEILSSGTQLMQQNPEYAGLDLLKQCFVRWRAFEATSDAKDAVSLELVAELHRRGQTADALDMLRTLPKRPDNRKIQHQKYKKAGSITYERWCESMSPGTPHSHTATKPLMHHWKHFENDTVAWSKAGRIAKEVHASSESTLKSALEDNPADTESATKLIHVLLAQGRKDEAFDLGKKQTEDASDNVSAHRILLWLLLGKGALKDGDAKDVAICCARILLLDPWDEQALKLLLCKMQELSVGCEDLIISALCTYINTHPHEQSRESDAYASLSAYAEQCALAYKNNHMKGRTWIYSLKLLKNQPWWKESSS